MANSNYLSKIAIVGAGGNSGKFMTEALLKTGKHTITALARMESQSKLPDGVLVKNVDFGKREALVEALRGQDALVITLSPVAPKETEMQLIEAAGEAGVSWIMPNDWSPDTTNEALIKDVFLFEAQAKTRKAIADLGKSSYISLSTGFWYEWSLGIGSAYGIDIAKKTATFFDDGETKITTSTWPQVGRAVAALLSLPIKPEGSDQKACLQNFQNQVVYTSSFTVNQKEMLESVLRVTGVKKSEWTISHEPSHERYASGIKEMMEGSRIGFGKMMYTRVFYPDGCGDVETNKGTLNSLLGLPKEDIDESTKVAVERSKNPAW